ncbi:phosphatidylserine decarboxylase proenzyme [Nocardiopsis terrae]|uniref:Phosphatidylserine decarboxylase proenzyme n=1 Tax=Nocardiopsis terrae TaxID=372655 RepID=A0ABR9HFD1_9ACTN|nr:phosphatidylserine decarboxylase [Nocardiopsis terrae]MBE1457723.1 phosphatidylserine decarboxylase [Nocardiopsis terrae]GHC84591.1 phosphatidylserine decarboxylase proenzyme [Nocardiopsis terrae]
MTDDSPISSASPRPAARPRFGMAQGSAPWLLPALGAAGAATLLARRSRAGAAAAAPVIALAAGMAWFFRDPERGPATGRVLSAADGVVQSLDPQPDGRIRVAVFMNPLNVHVNRAPIAGIVTGVEHRPGGFKPAFDKDSERNERVIWTLETEIGEITVVQIAGAMVRRIVPYLAAGQKVEQGERIGLIRFGSRVDVHLPAGVAPAVEIGQRVRAGETRLDAG